MNTAKSQAAFEEAQRVLVGGINSPVRAFGKVGGTPRFIAKGRGSKIWDVDGNEYVDFVLAWGPLILGHTHPRVRQAIEDAVAEGWSFGAPTEREHVLAQEVQRRMPSIERLRLVSSGTEAAMSALRVARAHTRRPGFIKFEGAYHGHADPFLSKAGSGLASAGTPDSAGVPAHIARDAHNVPYNDLEAVERVVKEDGKRIGAIIVEPVAANMSLVLPQPGFLQGLRDVCDKHDLVLIFDEVITGFRVGPGGAQETYGVRPDLTCLGKILGGGLPAAGCGGRQDLMRLVAPEGPVYQAGTMAGNPLAVAAGLATLRELTDESYRKLDATTKRLADGICGAIGSDLVLTRAASMLGLVLTSGPVTNWSDVVRCDSPRYAQLFHASLERGVYLPPSPFETMFLSAAHSADDVDLAVAVVEQSWRARAPRSVTH